YNISGYVSIIGGLGRILSFLQISLNPSLRKREVAAFTFPLNPNLQCKQSHFKKKISLKRLF
ncbi:MAG: hypothetical protein ACOCUF_04010, partial [Patescibacteria group bacterium]